MSSSKDDRTKHAWDTILRELYDKKEVSENVLSDGKARMRWWGSLDPAKQDEITNRVRELSQGRKESATKTERQGYQRQRRNMEQYEGNRKDYYEILQVSPNAEESVIKAAYRKLAQTYHPDIAKDPTASAKMTDINEAYEVLLDPVSRATYDRSFRVRNDQQLAEDEVSDDDIIIGLMRFAAEKAAEGKNRSQVADELTKKGVPYDLAANIVQRVFEYRSELRRKEGGKSIGCGLLMLIVGGIVTGLTYSAASEGGTYFVTTGLLVVGGITLIYGIIKWLSS